MKIAMVTFWDDIPTLIPQLEKYDLIFACEKAAVELAQHHVKLSAVVSDFDSIENRDEMIAQLKERTDVVVLSPIKDESDSKALLQYIKEHIHYDTIDIYNSFDKRIDHALALLSFFQTEKKLRIITPQTSMCYHEPGVHVLHHSKQYPYISFIVIEQVGHISLKNFKYPLEKETVAIFSDLLISNEIAENESATLSFMTGKILAIESRDIR